ncbi:MAG: alpha/beta hydrolase [Ostreibacterium sp.]
MMPTLSRDATLNNPLLAPPALIIEPDESAQSTIIWLHGLGANAHEFEDIIPLLPTVECRIRMIFPNAPKRPITVNDNAVMPAWYDISDMALKNIDAEGIEQSNQIILQLIEKQIEAGIPSQKIVIAGFSQGGAMALHTGLRCLHPLAGIIALSCYVLAREKHAEQVSSANHNTPIWMAHGQHDPVVPHTLGRSSERFLTNNKHRVTFVSYPIAHEVCTPEISAFSQWLLRILG